ncbi:MAG: glycosyltransferase [Candidatus Bathyarchaeia archaeon]
MIKKIDLVMWAKNGERFLSLVLKRIDEVIPSDCVNKKIFVDDHSADGTVKIARDFNWTVYENPASGIASGVEEALRHVECEHFVSIEQDVLLAKDWWEKVPPYIEEKDVACAQGIRISISPALRALEEYAIKERRTINVSIDNNIFKTKVLKALGKIPRGCPVCVDSAIMKQIVWKTPYKWVTTAQVVSLHLSRDSIWNYLKHYRRIAKMCRKTIYCTVGGVGFSKPLNPKFRNVIRVLLTSPLRGLQLAIKKKQAHIFWAYPATRLYSFPESIREWKKLMAIDEALTRKLPPITLKIKQENDASLFVWQREENDVKSTLP